MEREIGVIFRHTRGKYAGHFGYCVFESKDDYREFHSRRPDLFQVVYGATDDDFLRLADRKAKRFPPE